MAAEAFLEEVLLGRFKAGGFYVGADFAFGKGRRGNAAFLREECRRRGLFLKVHPLLRSSERKIGSSVIRSCLMGGDLKGANRMLGRPYRLEGTVLKGAGLGRKLGFPTANLRVDPDKLLPPGVFEVRVGLGSKTLAGVANIGQRPTLSGPPKTSVEVHLLGWKGSLYGRRLALDLARRIREERKFPSLAALRDQIRRDAASVRA